MITLLFPLTETVALTEHAMAAPQHVLSACRQQQGLPAVQALRRVKDDGIYLMSNGIPGLPADPKRPHAGQHIAYARGRESGTRQDLGRLDETGGDDFVEHFELTEPLPDRTRLIHRLQAAARRNRRWFALLVDGDTVGYAFTNRTAAGGRR